MDLTEFNVNLMFFLIQSSMILVKVSKAATFTSFAQRQQLLSTLSGICFWLCSYLSISCSDVFFK